jgi:hypothetical protein
VPFYVGYRDFDRHVPSCFGGFEAPPGYAGGNRDGTYYMTSPGEWKLWEWERCVKDSGIVITVYGHGVMHLAVFGFTGWATAAVGNAVLDQPEKFWPEDDDEQPGKKKGKPGAAQAADKENLFEREDGTQIGVYICEITYRKDTRDTSPTWDGEECFVEKLDVVPLGRDTLASCIG